MYYLVNVDSPTPKQMQHRSISSNLQLSCKRVCSGWFHFRNCFCKNSVCVCIQGRVMCISKGLVNDTAGKLVWTVWLPRELLSLTCYQKLPQQCTLQECHLHCSIVHHRLLECNCRHLQFTVFTFTIVFYKQMCLLVKGQVCLVQHCSFKQYLHVLYHTCG